MDVREANIYIDMKTGEKLFEAYELQRSFGTDPLIFVNHE
jgi:hypothetical protein